MVAVQTPISNQILPSCHINDQILLSGSILCGRDAVLPKIVKMLEEGTFDALGIDLRGAAVFHTAVSPAGVGPTSSNKPEIEASIAPLSRAGVKLHLGKGRLRPETVEALRQYDAIYAVIPPVTALLEAKTLKRELVAFPELGMEALWRLEVEGYPAIIAAAHGEDIYR